MESERPDHAARPEQTEEGFAEGLEREPRTPEEERVGDFAEGEKAGLPGDERTGRFSEGVELAPETPEKNVEGSFAEGVEADPTDRYAEAGEEATIREATERDE